jgi:hypothetical protein
MAATKSRLAPKKGTTKACGHPGCKVILRYTLEGWKHSVRNWTYDHEPVDPAKGTPS